MVIEGSTYHVELNERVGNYLARWAPFQSADVLRVQIALFKAIALLDVAIARREQMSAVVHLLVAAEEA